MFCFSGRIHHLCWLGCYGKEDATQEGRVSCYKMIVGLPESK